MVTLKSSILKLFTRMPNGDIEFITSKEVITNKAVDKGV